jgi:hypothetical protein
MVPRSTDYGKIHAVAKLIAVVSSSPRGSAMKNVIRSVRWVVALFTLCLVPAVHAAEPGHHWSQRFGSAAQDVALDVVVAPTGEIHVCGTFTGTVNLGGSPLVSAGGQDIFVAKFSAAGTHIWSARFGSAGNDQGIELGADPAGNIYMTGSFELTVNFGGGNLSALGSRDIFIVKLNSSGVHQWSQRHGAFSSESAQSITVDALGQVSIAGHFIGATNLGGAVLGGTGADDIFVASYTSNGAHLWSQWYGSSLNDGATDIVADSNGDLTITGYFSGPISFGGGTLNGTDNLFLVQFNAAGVHQWSQGFGSSASDFGFALAIGPADDIIVGGGFGGNASFGGATLINAGQVDILLARYTSTGAHVWSKGIGGSGTDYANAVTADAEGDVSVTGPFDATVNFGGGNLVSAGGLSDIFIAQYAPNGNYTWAKRAGSTELNLETGTGIDVDASGNVVATGYFYFTVNFGGADLVSAGGQDTFLAKYDSHIQPPIIKKIADIGNDQGRQLSIRFERSAEDNASSSTPVLAYEVYRRDKAAPSLLATGEGTVRADGWTQVGSVAAHRENTYGIVVATIGDSTVALGQYRSAYFVRAATSNPGVFFDSPPDSGYSLDNLAPSIPQNFVYNAGDLTWDESSAEDFDFFTVYGSNTDAFGASVVVDYRVSPSMDVSGSPYAFYFVTATDFSGNEGKPARVNTLSGVGGTPKSYVLSVSNYPNPFNPRTTVSYTVPSRGSVTVSVYDARGTHVATLFNGDRSAGAYIIEWDGRGQSGTPVSTGVYFARIEHAGGTRSKKMLLLK